MRVLLVEDHRMVREGLRLLLAREVPEAAVAGEADTAAQGVKLAGELGPDLIVMDIHLPDGSGLEASRQVLAATPTARIIILSAEPSLQYVREALRIGVSGYLLKSNAPEEFPRAVRAVMAGSLYLCAEAGRAALEDYKAGLVQESAPRQAALSERELQVLRLIGDGLRTKEIADRLHVGVKTAETYRRRLLTKLGCGGTAEVVRYAVREGLLPP